MKRSGAEQPMPYRFVKAVFLMSPDKGAPLPGDGIFGNRPL